MRPRIQLRTKKNTKPNTDWLKTHHGRGIHNKKKLETRHILLLLTWAENTKGKLNSCFFKL